MFEAEQMLKRKPGRPRLNRVPVFTGDHPAEGLVTLKFNDDEIARLSRAAKGRKISISRYIKETLFVAVRSYPGMN
jgi:hypothetical protein